MHAVSVAISANKWKIDNEFVPRTRELAEHLSRSKHLVLACLAASVNNDE